MRPERILMRVGALEERNIGMYLVQPHFSGSDSINSQDGC